MDASHIFQDPGNKVHPSLNFLYYCTIIRKVNLSILTQPIIGHLIKLQIHI